MRGENLALLEIVPTVAETSPHAWRKRTDTVVRTAEGGNISTCMEKTPQKVVYLHNICDI